MRKEDKKIMNEYYPNWAKRCENINNIAISSAVEFETKIITNLFQNTKIHEINKENWDFNNKCPFNKFDLIIVSNAFLYSPNPKLWFKNISNVTRYLWLQDCSSGPLRGDDLIRYKYSSQFNSDFITPFDLVEYEQFIVGFINYKLETAGSHFLMFFDFERK